MLISQNKNWGGKLLQFTAEHVKLSCYLLNFNIQSCELQWPQSQHSFGSAAVYGTGTASWVAEQTDRCSELFNQLAEKLIYWGSPAVVKHFRNSCDSFKMLLLLLIFYHSQVPVSEMDILSLLGSVQSPSTTVKDDWIHYATKSTLKGTCSLVT